MKHVLPRLDFDTPELAESYDKVSSIQFEHGKILVAALAMSSGEHVLDIGTGTGRLAAYVSELIGPQGRVIGIDPLPHRVAIARAKGCANFETRIGRAEDLSQFPDATFDVVYLNSVFHWIEDKQKALAEMFRVLKPGGRLGLNSQDPEHPHEIRMLIDQALAAAGQKISIADADPVRGTDSASLERLVTEAGFMGYDGRLHTLIDEYADVSAIITWMASSSFGNFLAQSTAADQSLMAAHLAPLLEPRRTSEGYRLQRYLVFATARKPAM